MAFIRKNWQKDATNVLINTAVRGVGAVGGAFVTNKLFGEGKSKTMQNIGGPLVLLLGTLGDMMFDDQKIRSAFQGVATYGALHSVAVIAPDSVGTEIGINGLDVTKNPGAMFGGVGVLGETTQATPPEFALANGYPALNDTDGKTYNNDWTYLAQNIDNAEQITRTVDGVDYAPQTAAQLMGVDEEEASRLMGMF